MAPTIEPIVGRYLHLDIGGKPHRLYYEEAGEGMPLVCLHTAGADGRQYRHLLIDKEVTDHYRVLVFDMPAHGKSNPPDDFEKSEYQLTTLSYAEMILAFCDAMELERPVCMGCSIGGRIVLHLADAHPARFRALIGLESADYQEAWYNLDWLNHPDVHGGEVCAALVSGLIGPDVPPARRQETLWMYKQGGPGIFKGDLYFYRVDGDLRARTEYIDLSKCPLYMLTGEYDFSCSPTDSERTAAKINGATVTTMHGLGHFPMSEDPDKFRGYILPVLEEIRTAE